MHYSWDTYISCSHFQGWVTVLGAICPFFYATFRLKRVNDEKILRTLLRTLLRTHLHGQISWNFMTHPFPWALWYGKCPRSLPLLPTADQLHAVYHCQSTEYISKLFGWSTKHNPEKTKLMHYMRRTRHDTFTY